jgi:uncharacterized membrane protein YccF (DUF307 family)
VLREGSVTRRTDRHPAGRPGHAPSDAVNSAVRDSGTMRALLNVIWLIFGGLWLAIGYVIAGIVCFILIITIPFGIASFRIAGYALWPFGRTAIRRRDAGVMSIIGNVIWLLIAGWWLAVAHIVTGVLMCLTIIGIPLGLANFKLIPISLLPLGTQIVPSDTAYQ